MKSKLNRQALLTAVSLGLMLAATSAHAQVINGSFESGGGSYSGWTTQGDALIQTSSLGSGPTDGSFDALLASATDGSNGVAAGNGVSAATLESAMGVSSGTLQGLGRGNPIIGSVAVQSLSLVAGQTVSFDWDFLTNQTYNDGTSDSIAPSANNNDFSFVSLAPASGTAEVSVLADTFYGYVNDSGAAGGFQTGFQITPVQNPFISETLFHTFTWTATTTGVYTLGIGVVHAAIGQENGVNSGLLVDNVQVGAVPEPASCLALATFVGGVVGRRVRKGRKDR